MDTVICGEFEPEAGELAGCGFPVTATVLPGQSYVRAERSAIFA
jgi:hypothetical protein